MRCTRCCVIDCCGHPRRCLHHRIHHGAHEVEKAKTELLLLLLLLSLMRNLDG